MSRIRGSDTRPELMLRGALHAAGYRYRLHRRDLPGRPDIAFVRERVAVFVHGCFWHGCPLHYTAPHDRAEFWSAKLRENRERDARKRKALEEAGWLVLELWEHEVERDLGRVFGRVIRTVERRRKAPVLQLARRSRPTAEGRRSRLG